MALPDRIDILPAEAQSARGPPQRAGCQETVESGQRKDRKIEFRLQGMVEFASLAAVG